MLEAASLLAGGVDDTDTALLFDPSAALYEELSELDSLEQLIVVSEQNTVDARQFVSLPLAFPELSERIRFGVEGSMNNDFLDDGDSVYCIASMFDGAPDTITKIVATDRFHSGLYDFFIESRADPAIIRDVFEVAIDLGKKGQKGKPVGALFAVGDAGTVMNKSRPLSYNPFEKSHVHVGDPIVSSMLKEFSKLDGAFVISDSGKIVSAYRYLEPDTDGADVPRGLGARHMAASAITTATNSTAIVLSESDGMVRAFKDGELQLEIDPEDY